MDSKDPLYIGWTTDGEYFIGSLEEVEARAGDWYHEGIAYGFDSMISVGIVTVIKTAEISTARPSVPWQEVE